MSELNEKNLNEEENFVSDEGLDLEDVGALTFTNLVIFLLDRSGSMNETNTYDGNTKYSHLCKLTQGLLERFKKSRMQPAFKVNFVWFNDQAKILEKNGKKYFDQKKDNPLEIFTNTKNNFTPDNGTNITSALLKASEIVDEYANDTNLPEDRYVTVFLFTDGFANIEEDKVLDTANTLAFKLFDKISSGSLATIAFGKEANKELLRNIASPIKENQLNALQGTKIGETSLIDYVDPQEKQYNQKKIYIPFPKNGFTKEWIEVVRHFVEKVSETL